MTDMLVKLYRLPPVVNEIEALAAQGVTIRRALVPEKHHVVTWVRENFSAFWESEADVSFSRMPVSCFIAVEDKQPIGFGCYDTTSRGFFGPTGVSETARGRGIGKAIMLACMHDMLAQGYIYAIIGAVGPIEYYQKTVGAVVIDDSTPSVLAGLLRGKPKPAE
ncbi:MAG: N-acetyltransferase GCN5 [Chloroflexi bacterium OLB15]|nr:MAG: N-acetyltransferase GCN5 [Chloroflexi bacterium OLB15]